MRHHLPSTASRYAWIRIAGITVLALVAAVATALAGQVAWTAVVRCVGGNPEALTRMAS